MLHAILAALRPVGVWLRDLATTAGAGPTSAWARPRVRVGSARVGQLIAGLALLGFGVGMLLASGLGAGPFDVLHAALSSTLRLPLSVPMYATGAAMVGVGLLLGSRPRVGTLAPVVMVGPVVQFTLELLDPASGLAAWALAATGIVTIALGAGAYLTAGYGVGAAELVFDGLSRRGVPRWASRLGVEGAALTGGWLLGGPVGPATLAATVALALLIPHAIDLFEQFGVARLAPRLLGAAA